MVNSLSSQNSDFGLEPCGQSFCAKFACSPRPCESFLPQSKDIQIRILTDDSSLLMADCLYVSPVIDTVGDPASS